MRPEDVRSPKERVGDVRVLYTNKEEGWSIAEIQWRADRTSEWRWRVGMRWNGSNDEIGNPQSRGQPTWFMLPDGEISRMISEYAQQP
jgi:hypothetical protein